MTEAELRKKLMHRAGSLLSRRPHTRGELALKLSKLADPREVDAALDRLEELRLLNDAEYAYNFAVDRLTAAGWGPLKVRDSLLRRQVAPEVVDTALDRMRRELGDEPILERYLKKHCNKGGFPSDQKGTARLILHLRRRGFPDEAILRTLRRKIPPGAWQPFETGD